MYRYRVGFITSSILLTNNIVSVINNLISVMVKI